MSITCHWISVQVTFLLRDSVSQIIFGDAGSFQTYLQQYANKNVIFKGGYKNWEINSILEQTDVLVAPSIWYENSPLVIQEAFLGGIPVITSNIGGMSELVKDSENGFTFNVGDEEDLKNKLEMIIENPTILNTLKPNPDNVRSIEEDAENLISIYSRMLEK